MLCLYYSKSFAFLQQTALTSEELETALHDTFTHRLRERPCKQSYNELSELYKSLLRKRLAISSYYQDCKKLCGFLCKNFVQIYTLCQNKDFKIKRHHNGLKRMWLLWWKHWKQINPLGLINELFKPPNAGTDLIKSITVLMNRIKDHCFIPEIIRNVKIFLICFLYFFLKTAGNIIHYEYLIIMCWIERTLVV